MLDVPISVGKVHHYRNSCPKEQLDDCAAEDFKQRFVKDTSISQLEEEVIDNLVNI